ncbi:MAG TPA: hypothetical protein PKL44_00340 [Candidatus Dojkabacteria bacterium]|nr:hypothetical protein [Candidatus Dojkabacteria bacterium]
MIVKFLENLSFQKSANLGFDYQCCFDKDKTYKIRVLYKTVDKSCIPPCKGKELLRLTDTEDRACYHQDITEYDFRLLLRYGYIRIEE